MIELIIAGVVVVLAFCAGAIIGVNNVPTVDKAIAAIKAYEANAAATLAKITAHKAS